MADSVYKSVYYGKQIDDAIGRILSGDIDNLERSAANSAKSAANSATAAANSATAAANSATAAANSATAAANSAATAKQYSGNPPVPKNGTWWIWNADIQSYVDTGMVFSGYAPKMQNGTWWVWDASVQAYVDTGEYYRGNLMYATFWIDIETGNLYMFTNTEYNGPKFRLNGADLEVIIHA